MKENAQYYLIKERLVGKKENDLYYLFQDGKWVYDEKSVIMDHLWGYEDISFEEAMKLTGGNA